MKSQIKVEPSVIVDKVRASRDGHEYHEAWTARRALQLILPTSNLIGVAIEGLAPIDQTQVIAETVEIADIVLYYGKKSNFKNSDNVTVIQFKYSITNKNKDFRCSDAKKTLEKFSATYRDFKKKYGSQEVHKKLEFELATNRPIYPAFKKAIQNISNATLRGEIKQQADQFKNACGLKGKELIDFAAKFNLTGLSGSLNENKQSLSRVLVDWSATSDARAQARLGRLRQLVRDKAGYAGQNRNVIRRADVFDALDIADEKALLPCPSSFPKIGPLVPREQLANATTSIFQTNKPFLIHAAGGVGKTVFLENLTKIFSENNEVVLFDCFGGGIYRAPEDSRHLPNNGLIHIANTLACRGLCDPLLPSSENLTELIKTFRNRLSQTVKTLQRASPNKELILIIDAIDNAAEHAKDCNEKSFPKELLNSFQHGEPIKGVRLIVSCRTHRRDIAKGDVDCVEFELKPFSVSETENYLRNRRKKVTQGEIRVAHARSKGNARILEHLVNGDRGLLNDSEINKPLELETLLTDRINKALSAAYRRGYKKNDINAFLAGLAVLPPPVPINEYAEAHDMDLSTIESFAADLAPLLEHTKHGLMFRDEPTETLIRRDYSSDPKALKRVAKNLLKRQDSSVYAARALPGLLQKINAGKQLFQLAFDERFPQSIKSIVGKRHIRYARLKAATLYAAHKQDNQQLISLLVELSTIAAGDQRGADYILEHPDLVINAKDLDATRRLFETRTAWPGARHARLTIANVLSGDMDNAYIHAIRTDEWVHHHREKKRDSNDEKSGPEHIDIAAVPFFLIAQNRPANAISFMRGWKDWYAYEVSEFFWGWLKQTQSVMPDFEDRYNKFLNGLTDEVGVIASALSFADLTETQRKTLIKKLVKACKKIKQIDFADTFYRNRQNVLLDGLFNASAIAASMGLKTEAHALIKYCPAKRLDLWSVRDPLGDKYLLPFLIQTVLKAVKNRKLLIVDLLPSEIKQLCSSITTIEDIDDFKKIVLKRIENTKSPKDPSKPAEPKTLSYEQKSEAQRFINGQLGRLFNLAKALLELLRAPKNKADKALLNLLDVWMAVRKNHDSYSVQKFDRLFQILGSQIAVFSLSVRHDLKKTETVRSFLETLHTQEITNVSTLIRVVEILSGRDSLHTLAGEEAKKAVTLIEKEDDVSSRASLYAQLGRAILSASNSEAAAYFKLGLEQMDTIGSGDYQFTNELLLFASSLKGKELKEQDFHTLTNICELNMSSEEEKFPWFAFAKALSRTSGLKGLAKLGRWDDRSKISLDYTLLPYLTALIEDDKIAPEDALALLRLSNPAELYSCGTDNFAQALDKKNHFNKKELLLELIKQFEDNNPGMPTRQSLKTLADIADKIFGKNNKKTLELYAAHKHFCNVIDQNNENSNYHGQAQPGFSRIKKSDHDTWEKLGKIVARTTPDNEVSMVQAINELNSFQFIYELKGKFFDALRKKLKYSNRSQYIKIIAYLQNLDLYTKLAELKKCKKEWEGTSTALEDIYESIGIPILQLHTENFVSFGQLSGGHLKELSDLSSVSMVVLAQELIKIFASPDWLVPASVWLALASVVCEDTDKGAGNIALSRLLNSDAAKLASSVLDGEWKPKLYLSNEVENIAGLVWRMLGSPQAADRWRAAHSVRCFAKFDRWNIITCLVGKLKEKIAPAFQAPELKFYYQHARLWLLIALARIAKDNPIQISKHKKIFLDFIFDEKSPHILINHFSKQIIDECVSSGCCQLSDKQMKLIKNVNISPFERQKKPRDSYRTSFYVERPKTVSKSKFEFYLDYDFEKYEVQGLCDVFGMSGWELKDMLVKAVQGHDDTIKSMHDRDGRTEGYREDSYRMTSKRHSYGQQLGWHALMNVAGQLILKKPIIDGYYDNNSWADWMERYLLTGRSGLWLSDGIDSAPLATKVNLLEKGEKSLVITGNKSKILDLLNLSSTLNKDIVVDGRWTSTDKINVSVSSVLVPHKRIKKFAKKLIKETPFSTYLPAYEERDEEYIRNEKTNCYPWTVHPSIEGKLDEDDPLGSIAAMCRPHFSKEINTLCNLKSDDFFRRNWKNSTNRTVVAAQAWGTSKRYESEGSESGTRLTCSPKILKSILKSKKSDLLILVKLERYEKESYNRSGQFSNTIAAIRINKRLNVKYLKGAINLVHVSKRP